MLEWVDENGERIEVEVRIYQYDSTTVDRDGTVHHVHETADGREEWSEPLCDSPVRGALPEWVWDLTMDPRGPAELEQAPPGT